ncbi:MAG: hypothetical protein JWO86_6767 [Myxococcaceae bacterium]|nr:hypothetical protein [Myxococcaceae bacterium]
MNRSSSAGRHIWLAVASAALIVATPALARAEGDTKLHIEGPPGLVVEHRDGAKSKWAFACNTPCDEEVSLFDQYRIDGGDAFRLERPSGDVVTIRFEPRSPSATAGGVAVTIVGVGVTVFGLALTLLGAAAAAPCSAGAEGWSVCGGGPGTLVAGLVVSGIGIVGIVGGVSVASQSGSKVTRVENAASPREPTWSAPRATAVAPSEMVLPIRFSF